MLLKWDYNTIKICLQLKPFNLKIGQSHFKRGPVSSTLFYVVKESGFFYFNDTE